MNDRGVDGTRVDRASTSDRGRNVPVGQVRQTAGAMDAVRVPVAEYYSAKIARHGAKPRGVDWLCQPAQELRFVQLLRFCDLNCRFSLDDLGCGYGALVTYVERIHPGAMVDYLGIDLSSAMIREARCLHPESSTRRFMVGHASPRVADFAVASGIMNVKLHNTDEVWEEFVAATLCDMWRSTRQGFAINFMAEAPAEMIHPQLYRTHPERWVAYCVFSLGCSVEVLTGYGLREFTLIARHGRDGIQQ
jgi:SAM-dependent methyltransferase